MQPAFLEPGAYVRLIGAPEWGIGQVQSVCGLRVTVNFENAGKQLIHMASAELIVIADEENRQWTN